MSIHIHYLEPGSSVDDAAALDQFQKQWATYQKMVDHDALSHKEVGSVLHQALMGLSRPFDFLDIACGDAGQMKRALKDTKARSYRGIDLSEPALELAAENLAGAPFAVELDDGDFVNALCNQPRPTDVTWCGLSIHHLSTDGKRKLIEAMCGATHEVAMIYEPTLAEGEDREAYLARFRRVNRPAWTFLSDDEWHQIDHHVTTCDLPEHAATWLALGREAGFADATQIFLDPTGFYGLYRYDRERLPSAA